MSILKNKACFVVVNIYIVKPLLTSILFCHLSSHDPSAKTESQLFYQFDFAPGKVLGLKTSFSVVCSGSRLRNLTLLDPHLRK